jgi:hypothetical protein
MKTSGQVILKYGAFFAERRYGMYKRACKVNILVDDGFF